MIKIYGVPLSPFVRKAIWALEYKGLEFENEPTLPGDASPDFRAISPLGKIPVLAHDGFTVPDTSVICRYIDRIAPEPGLYPTDPKLEAQACWLEEFADSRLMDACGGVFQERWLKPNMLNEATDEARLNQLLDHSLPEAVSYVESVCPESGYLVGDSLTIADLAVTTCFIQAQYGGYEVDGEKYPKLRSYLDGAYGSELVQKRREVEANVIAAMAGGAG